MSGRQYTSAELSRERRLVSHRENEYRPPATRAELESRYGAGERSFPGTDLEGADLSGVVLDGAFAAFAP